MSNFSSVSKSTYTLFFSLNFTCENSIPNHDLIGVKWTDSYQHGANLVVVQFRVKCIK
jgi:hypothetical protein